MWNVKDVFLRTIWEAEGSAQVLHVHVQNCDVLAVEEGHPLQSWMHIWSHTQQRSVGHARRMSHIPSYSGVEPNYTLIQSSIISHDNSAYLLRCTLSYWSNIVFVWPMRARKYYAQRNSQGVSVRNWLLYKILHMKGKRIGFLSADALGIDRLAQARQPVIRLPHLACSNQAFQFVRKWALQDIIDLIEWFVSSFGVNSSFRSCKAKDSLEFWHNACKVFYLFCMHL